MAAENYWISISQEDHFKEEVRALTSNNALPSKSCLLSLHPLLDSSGILRVSGREQNSKLSYSNLHPVILHGKHPVTKLIIHTEHLHLLHAGPTLLTSSLCCRLHIIGCRKIVHSLTRACTVCCRNSAKPQPQMMGQLPTERTPCLRGSVLIMPGHSTSSMDLCVSQPLSKPMHAFLSLSVKAVQLVSDLTS